MAGSFVGSKIVLVPKFEPDEVWRLVAAEKVGILMITGDAMGRPLIESLTNAATPPDSSSLFLLVSTAAVFSPTVKDDFFEFLPNLLIIDSIGSSESGATGMALITKGNTAMLGGGPTVKAGVDTVVLDEDLEIVAPGSGVRGKLARSGDIPLEYYKDPEKSAETFVVAKDGRRYAVPGDWAQLEEDGTITLLGRGSVSINSGGEKIFPEEVEAAVKDHADAYDAVVIGVPDERFGNRVAVVIEPRGSARPSLEEIQAHCRTKIAGFKIPRQLHLVDRIERSRRSYRALTQREARLSLGQAYRHGRGVGADMYNLAILHEAVAEAIPEREGRLSLGQGACDEETRNRKRVSALFGSGSRRPPSRTRSEAVRIDRNQLEEVECLTYSSRKRITSGPSR